MDSGRSAAKPFAQSGQERVGSLELALAVERSQRARDAELERRVTRRLHAHPSVSSRSIDVEVERGVVRLTGTVTSDFQKLRAERSVALEDGVRRVDNQLQVVEPSIAVRSDGELRRELESELARVPRLDRSALELKVEEGVVTISGLVADWDVASAIWERVYAVSPREFVNGIDVKEPPRDTPDYAARTKP